MKNKTPAPQAAQAQAAQTQSYQAQAARTHANLAANKLGAFATLLNDTAMSALEGRYSPSAAVMLLTLLHHPNVTVSALARVTGISQPAATRLADGLIGKKLVERFPGARQSDRRAAPLMLTAAGVTEAMSLQRARISLFEDMLDVLPRPERAAFERSIDTLLAAATTSWLSRHVICRMCDQKLCSGAACPVETCALEIERQEELTTQDRPPA